MKRIIVTLFSAITYMSAAAQGWSLDSCIAYAHRQNYDVLRANLAMLNAEVMHKSAKVSMTPSVNAGIGQDFSFGLAQGANNVKENRTQASTTFNAAVSMPIFTGLRVTNQIRRTGLDLQAAMADIESAKESVELNVMVYYLNVLYCHEMVDVQSRQLELTRQLLERTRQLVAAGKQSEGELYEIEAQEAQDVSLLTDAENNYRTAKIELCQLINYRDVEHFEVETECAAGEVDDELLPSPDAVFESARLHRPAIKAQNKRIESAQYAVREAKADFYPQLSLNASWGTGYFHVFNFSNPAFGRQFVDNGSEVVGLSLSIPIYNRMQVRHSVRRSRIALEQEKLAALEIEDRLYKDIQTAYYNAIAARDKYRSSQLSLAAGNKAFEFALSKYDLGRMSAYEFNEIQTRRAKAQTEETQAKYEYMLRTKILNFYAE